MDLQSLNDADLEREILRISQALGGGTSTAQSRPRKLSPREASDTEWRLRRIEQELGVLDRPRRYDVPEEAMAPRFEGPLREDEKTARPMGTHGVMTPEFTRETGIYMTPDGTITNRGSRGTPAYQEDPALAEDRQRLQEEKRRLEQAMAGHQEAMRLEEMAKQGEAPERPAWGETPQGSREKIAGGIIEELVKGSGKISKAEEKNIESLIERKQEIDQILDLNKIEENGLLRDLTPEEATRLQGVSDRLGKKIKRVSGEGGGEKTAPTVDAGAESVEVNGTIYLIPNLRREMQQNPERWQQAVERGLIPPEVAETVQSGAEFKTDTPSKTPSETAGADRLTPEEMAQEIKQAKDAKDRPRLHRLRKANPDAYKKGMKIYREQSGGTEKGGREKNELPVWSTLAWTKLSDAEKTMAEEYINQGLDLYAKNGKVYVKHLNKEHLIGPKGT